MAAILLIVILAMNPILVLGGPVNLTLVHNAVAKGAVCLDGSPPGYYHDQGVGDGVNHWVLYLMGGDWCKTLDECIFWKQDPKGNSSKMAPAIYLEGMGILSPIKSENSDFFNWNRVWVNYCDGASFLGDVAKVNSTDIMYFRGARVFAAIVDDLLSKGMNKADNVILSGGSAGGLAVILHCDRFRAQVPNAKRLKCLSDAGYFIQGKDILRANEITIGNPFGDLVKLQGIDKFLPQSCLTKMDAKWCLFPENLVGDIQTPLFLINGDFDWFQVTKKVPSAVPILGACRTNASACNVTQIQVLREFRTSFLNALPKGNCWLRGMFIDSANSHEHIMFSSQRWYGPEPNLKNKTVAEGFASWFFDKDCFQEIDLEHDVPRNFY